MAKKKMFESHIDLRQIPSYRSRFLSMDRLGGGINLEQEPVDVSPAVDAEKDLRKKLGSFQDIRSNPGIILRRRGLK